MPVIVACRTPRARAWRAHVGLQARRVLRFLDLGARELSVSLVDDGEMQALNHDYRRRDQPTDVLAFALDETVNGAPTRSRSAAAADALLGDVVISIDTAAAQARSRRRTMTATLDELLVHGMLHLIGYDHEVSPAEARRMFRKAREVEAALRGAHPATPTRRAAPRRRVTTAAAHVRPDRAR